MGVHAPRSRSRSRRTLADNLLERGMARCDGDGLMEGLLVLVVIVILIILLIGAVRR